MKTSPAYSGRSVVPQWRPDIILTLMLAMIISACGGGGGGGGTTAAPPPPPPASGAADSGAVYVVTVDPATGVAQQAYIKASNTEADDRLGWSTVALSGDTLVAGAHHEGSAATGIDGDQSDNSLHRAGAAYVFTRDAAGIWSQQAYIKASNTDEDDAFGVAFALSGDTLAVSGFDDSAATGIDGDQSDSSVAGAGAVYVFTRTAGVWSQQAYIKASNTAANIFFGTSIALSGDTLAVSTPWEDSGATGINGDDSNNNAAGSGAVYVFTRTAGVWSQQAYIKASNTDNGDHFGLSVALSGDTLAVGSRFEDSAATGINGDQSDNSAADAGAVYVYTRTAGVWSQQAYIKASNSSVGDAFGSRVALSGDRLAVGAHLEDSAATGIDGDQSDNTEPNAGAAYVFTRDMAGVWSQLAYVKASNADAGDEFGLGIALTSDTLAVGASYEDSDATGIDGAQSNTGFSGTVVAVQAFGSDPNAIKPSSSDVIPVAVLGSMNFDATQVDFSTAEFGPGKALPIRNGDVEDVNNDDILDMVFHFNTQETGITCGDTDATLSGKTFGGDAFTGTESVKAAGCR